MEREGKSNQCRCNEGKGEKDWYIVKGYRKEDKRCSWRNKDKEGKGLDIYDRCD